MKNTCHPAPTDKKKYITDIGRILVKDYGKKKYYQPEEVKKAHRKSTWYDGIESIDSSCWAMSIFSSHEDFDKYHTATDETCNYVEMKTEMLNGLTVSPDADWAEIPNADIDVSWLDFGDAFEGLLDGLGELVVGIFDGI